MTRVFNSFRAAAEGLARMAEETVEGERKGAIAAGEHLVASARDMIGLESNEGWAPLADSTIEERQRLGYGGKVSPTDPLLREGDLRDSISARTDNEGRVIFGSTSPLAPYQEFGTSRIPPRPFIEPTMFREQKPATLAWAEHVMEPITGRRPRAVKT